MTFSPPHRGISILRVTVSFWPQREHLWQPLTNDTVIQSSKAFISHLDSIIAAIINSVGIKTKTEELIPNVLLCADTECQYRNKQKWIRARLVSCYANLQLEIQKQLLILLLFFCFMIYSENMSGRTCWVGHQRE